MKEKITVLLSTYNGEAYLEQQLNSILKQSSVDVSLLIRDDGSTDNTVKILNEFEQLNNVTVLYGRNVGWKTSFFELLRQVEYEDGMYYAFADQDDYWLPNKLNRAIELIKPYDMPVVYHSNVKIVNENLDFLSERFSSSFVPSTILPYAFFDSIALGCTMVFNSKILKLAKCYVPKEKTQHDAFIFALGFLLGRVVYDSSSYILYRRHQSATSGFGRNTKNGHPSLLMRYKKYKNGPKNNFSIRAKELLNGYGSLFDKRQFCFLKQVGNYQSNFKYRISLLASVKTATGIRRSLQIKYRILNNTL